MSWVHCPSSWPPQTPTSPRHLAFWFRPPCPQVSFLTILLTFYTTFIASSISISILAYLMRLLTMAPISCIYQIPAKDTYISTPASGIWTPATCTWPTTLSIYWLSCSATEIYPLLTSLKTKTYSFNICYLCYFNIWCLWHFNCLFKSQFYFRMCYFIAYSTLSWRCCTSSSTFTSGQSSHHSAGCYLQTLWALETCCWWVST